MIVGNIHEIDTGFIHYPKLIAQALEFLRTHDFSTMADGKYPIDGEKSFALLQRYQTHRAADAQPETHQKFLDIQYIVSGEEYLGWCSLKPNLQISKPYQEDQDITFYESLIPDSNIVLLPGSFAVLYPHDVHRPGGAIEDVPSPVTKVVVKIAIDCL